MPDINYQELDLKANLGAFSTLDAEVLIPEVLKLKSGQVYLEVGVDKGKSLSIVQMVVEEGVQVWGVDLQDDPKVKGTTFLKGDSVAMAKRYEEEDMDKINVLFIDGDHSYEGCKRDIDAWYPLMEESGVMLFHDHDESSPGVMQACSEFVNTHKVREYKVFKRTDKNTSMALIRL